MKAGPFPGDKPINSAPTEVRWSASIFCARVVPTDKPDERFDMHRIGCERRRDFGFRSEAPAPLRHRGGHARRCRSRAADRGHRCHFAGALAAQARDKLGIRRPASSTHSGSAGRVPLRIRSPTDAARDPLPRIGGHTASRWRVFGPQLVSGRVDGPADGVSPPLRVVRSHAAPVVAIPRFQPSRRFALSRHLGHLFGSGNLQ